MQTELSADRCSEQISELGYYGWTVRGELLGQERYAHPPAGGYVDLGQWTPATQVENARLAISARSLLEDTELVLNALLAYGYVLHVCEQKSEGSELPTEDQVYQRASLDMGADVRRILQRTEDLLKRRQAPAAPTAERLSDVRQFARWIGPVVLDFPVEAAVLLADDLGTPEAGHAVVVAHQRLKGFVTRHDERFSQKVRTVGELYARGVLTIVAAAKLVDLQPRELLPLLEQAHLCRELQQIKLNDTERRAHLVRLQTQRRPRAEEAQLSTEAVLREVIASQRIEGVDASRWLLRG